MGVIGTVLGWFVAIVAAVAVFSGPADAVAAAKTGLTAIGTTAGALQSGVKDGVKAYNQTKPKPAPAQKQP